MNMNTSIAVNAISSISVVVCGFGSNTIDNNRMLTKTNTTATIFFNHGGA